MDIICHYGRKKKIKEYDDRHTNLLNFNYKKLESILKDKQYDFLIRGHQDDFANHIFFENIYSEEFSQNRYLIYKNKILTDFKYIYSKYKYPRLSEITRIVSYLNILSNGINLFSYFFNAKLKFDAGYSFKYLNNNSYNLLGDIVDEVTKLLEGLPLYTTVFFEFANKYYFVQVQIDDSSEKYKVINKVINSQIEITQLRSFLYKFEMQMGVPFVLRYFDINDLNQIQYLKSILNLLQIYKTRY